MKKSFILSKIKRTKSILSNYLSHESVYYIVEDPEWSIANDGYYITKNLNIKGIKSKTTLSHVGILHSIIHFGSINVFIPYHDKINIPHRSNKVIVTYFHALPNDTRIKNFQFATEFIDIWHTTNSITKQKLISLGISEEKIVVIPLGVDLSIFKPLTPKGRCEIKKYLKIPEDRIVIGSFQKDGQGWNEGLEPKLIKGPDIFCEVVKKLSKDYPIFVLLTGPARGYVKNQLEKMGIPNKHIFAKYSELPNLYNILDLYLITSRVEGGPKAVLECMACSIPFVTTKVGIVSDIIRDFENGLICEVDDIDGLVKKSEMIIEDKNLREKILQVMAEDIKQYSWENISKEYIKKIYSRFIYA